MVVLVTCGTVHECGHFLCRQCNLRHSQVATRGQAQSLWQTPNICETHNYSLCPLYLQPHWALYAFCLCTVNRTCTKSQCTSLSKMLSTEKKTQHPVESASASSRWSVCCALSPRLQTRVQWQERQVPNTGLVFALRHPVFKTSSRRPILSFSISPKCKNVTKIKIMQFHASSDSRDRSPLDFPALCFPRYLVKAQTGPRQCPEAPICWRLPGSKPSQRLNSHNNYYM